MDIKWDDTDPGTGKRRFVKAERFAGRWTFFCRRERRGVWAPSNGQPKGAAEAFMDQHLTHQIRPRIRKGTELLAQRRKVFASQTA